MDRKFCIVDALEWPGTELPEISDVGGTILEKRWRRFRSKGRRGSRTPPSRGQRARREGYLTGDGGWTVEGRSGV